MSVPYELNPHNVMIWTSYAHQVFDPGIQDKSNTARINVARLVMTIPPWTVSM